jgi:hypothetical protein
MAPESKLEIALDGSPILFQNVQSNVIDGPKEFPAKVKGQMSCQSPAPVVRVGSDIPQGRSAVD